MLIKIVTVFLVFMVVLAIFGKLRMPKLPMPRRGDRIPPAKKCPDCGTYLVDGRPCSCGKRT